jgi:hypothetical protein
MAHFISDIVDALDLSEIEAVYEEELRGYPPYHPRMMTKLWLYAYAVGMPPGTSQCRRGGDIGGGTRRAQTGEPIHVTPSSKARRPCHCQRAAQMAEQRQISRHAHAVDELGPTGLLQRDQRRPPQYVNFTPEAPSSATTSGALSGRPPSQSTPAGGRHRRWPSPWRVWRSFTTAPRNPCERPGGLPVRFGTRRRGQAVAEPSAGSWMSSP